VPSDPPAPTDRPRGADGASSSTPDGTPRPIPAGREAGASSATPDVPGLPPVAQEPGAEPGTIDSVEGGLDPHDDGSCDPG
jgi:hypothetical protein